MDAFLSAVSYLGAPTYWLALLAAIGIGTAVGFIPGVGATLVTAIMVPFVVFTIEDPVIGIVMLAMVASLNNTLDSIPAVLVGLPGSETQVTYLEGHQLARKGRGAHTLGAVYAVSAMGGVIGAATLALIIPVIKPFILGFTYAEITVLALFGIAMVALLSRGAMLKGLAAGLFGILLGTVGVDPLTGTPRFTLGQIELWEGLPLVATILGFFALPELLDLTMTRKSVAPKDTRVSVKDVLGGARYGLGKWKIVIRQSLFGTFMGAVPGIGGSVIDWLAYAFGISVTRKKEGKNFGKGSLDGVIFAESAQNSKAGGQALPTLTLGVPGSTSWAIIVVALLAYGVTPGPAMLEQHADLTTTMVFTLAIGNLIVAAMGLVATNWLTKITLIPYPTVGFMIMAMVFLAAFMDMNNWLALPILLVFSIAGLLMKRYRWPRPPLVLGFILGPVVDENLQSALSIYGPVGVMTRPITIVLFCFLVVSVITLLRLTSRPIGAASEQVTHSGPADEPAAGGRAHGTWAAGSQRRGADKATMGRRLRSRLWNEEHFGPLIVVGAATALVIASMDYPPRARALPLAAGLGIIALGLMQLARQVLSKRPRNEEILDLGLRSSGMEGSGRTALVVATMLALFLLLTVLVGLKYAAIVLAAFGPVLLLSGKQRWVSGVISGCVVAVFAVFLMERFAGVIWPEPIVLSWLQDAFL